MRALDRAGVVAVVHVGVMCIATTPPMCTLTPLLPALLVFETAPVLRQLSTVTRLLEVPLASPTTPPAKLAYSLSALTAPLLEQFFTVMEPYVLPTTPPTRGRHYLCLCLSPYRKRSSYPQCCRYPHSPPRRRHRGSLRWFRL